MYADNDGSEDLTLAMLMLVYAVHSNKLIWDVDLNIVAMSAKVPANQGIVLQTQSPFKEVMSSSFRAVKQMRKDTGGFKFYRMLQNLSAKQSIVM